MSRIPLVMDNIIFSLQRIGGASVYWGKLEQAFDQDNSISMSVVERNDACNNLVRKNIDLCNSTLINSKCKNLRLDEISKIDINFPTIFHASDYRVGKGSQCVNIVTVYDFIAFRYFSGILKLFSKRQIKRAVANADILLCISESTKRDLLHFLPESSSKQIVVTPLSHDSDYYCSNELTGINETVVFIGSRINSYKNFKVAVDAVARNGNVKLLIIGANLNETEVNYLEATIPGRYDNVVFPSKDEIREIFNSSLALLYLSEYEGFGIPVLEGLASGIPVIAANRSSIPEVAGDAAILLDDITPEVVSQSIERLRTDYRYFASLRSAGVRQAGHFSWERCIRETYEVYEEASERFRLK